MSRFRKKSEAEQAYKEGKENIRLRVRQLGDRVLNQVYDEFERAFSDAESEGKILYVRGDDDTLRALLLKSAQRELGAGEEQ